MIPTKKQLARWADLKNRRDREESGLFLAEGPKVVAEVQAAGWTVEALLVRTDSSQALADQETYLLTADQLERVSGFRTAPEVVAVVRRPLTLEGPRWTPGTLALVLDGVQDPGNVGTLVRTAAWFGFSAVFHTAETADPFGPKAVQASMGALFHVKTWLIQAPWWDELPPGTAVMGTFLDGEPVFGADLPREGLVVFGSEGRGIGADVEPRVTRRLTIPRTGAGAESLNVATAAAVVMAEFRRGHRG